MAAKHASPVQALLVDEAFDGEVFPHELLAKHTSYRLGGPARFYVEASSVGALRQLVDTCAEHGTPWTVMGRGSNLLVADEGFPGVVVTLGRDFRTFRFDEESSRFSVGAGVLLSSVVHDAFRRCLEGLEFAVDIPGTVGGALRMNAGTRETGIGDRVASATVLRAGTGLVRLEADDLAWGYRRSPFLPDDVIVECELSVASGNPFYIRSKMEAAHARRRKTQPQSKATCGSVFRNPEGGSAGQLIEELGLKGSRIGGASVSDVHANFIENDGTASAQDVSDLIEMIQEKVEQAHGIKLQPEVRFLGFAQDR